MPVMRTKQSDPAAELSGLLSEALQRERMVPRFVDSYVVEHGRYGLQVHAALYRDLLALLHREALLALTVRTLELATAEAQPAERLRPRQMPQKDARAFRRRFLAALTRQQR